MKIKSVTASKNLSSLGSETLKVVLTFEDASHASVVMPAGISAGKYEAKIVSADAAILEVEKISSEICGVEFDQKTLDDKLVSMGIAGNSSLAVSAAFWRGTNGRSESDGIKFPKLMMLLFEGGRHGSLGIKMQEFMIIEETMEGAQRDFKQMRDYLRENKIETTVGAEGGFSPVEFDDKKVLEVIRQVFPNGKIAIDAAGSFVEDRGFNYSYVIEHFGLSSLEDPYSDEQWEEWKRLFGQFKDKLLIVGDDLTTTNPERIKNAAGEQTINAVIIKPNQNGTISGTIEAVTAAREAGLKVVVSHRGEETDDDWIVDFALAVCADYVKFGGMDRGERIAKYNRLLDLGMK